MCVTARRWRGSSFNSIQPYWLSSGSWILPFLIMGIYTLQALTCALPNKISWNIISHTVCIITHIWLFNENDCLILLWMIAFRRWLWTLCYCLKRKQNLWFRDLLLLLLPRSILFTNYRSQASNPNLKPSCTKLWSPLSQGKKCSLLWGDISYLFVRNGMFLL